MQIDPLATQKNERGTHTTNYERLIIVPPYIYYCEFELILLLG